VLEVLLRLNLLTMIMGFTSVLAILLSMWSLSRGRYKFFFEVEPNQVKRQVYTGGDARKLARGDLMCAVLSLLMTILFQLFQTWHWLLLYFLTGYLRHITSRWIERRL
jgi:hypothetical protein